jgi:UDP-2,3-diacylglucosamine pyrophosphatase LpxH
MSTVKDIQLRQFHWLEKVTNKERLQSAFLHFTIFKAVVNIDLIK